MARDADSGPHTQPSGGSRTARSGNLPIEVTTHASRASAPSAATRRPRGLARSLPEGGRDAGSGIRAGATDGQRVAYLRSTVLNGGERCICLFEASSEDLVRRANDLAQIPIASIAAAVDYDFTREENSP